MKQHKISSVIGLNRVVNKIDKSKFLIFRFTGYINGANCDNLKIRKEQNLWYTVLEEFEKIVTLKGVLEIVEVPKELIEAAKQYKNFSVAYAESQLWASRSYNTSIRQIAEAVKISRL